MLRFEIEPHFLVFNSQTKWFNSDHQSFHGKIMLSDSILKSWVFYSSLHIFINYKKNVDKIFRWTFHFPTQYIMFSLVIHYKTLKLSSSLPLWRRTDQRRVTVWFNYADWYKTQTKYRSKRQQNFSHFACITF